MSENDKPAGNQPQQPAQPAKPAKPAQPAQPAKPGTAPRQPAPAPQPVQPTQPQAGPVPQPAQPAPQPAPAPAPQPAQPGRPNPAPQPAQPGQAPAFGQPQPQPQQPGAGGYQPQPNPGMAGAGYVGAPAPSGKATAAVVVGVLSIVFSGPILGLILGIVAIILGNAAVRESGKSGKTTAARVCGIIGIVLSVIFTIVMTVSIVGAINYAQTHPEGSSFSYSYDSDSGFSSSDSGSSSSDSGSSSSSDSGNSWYTDADSAALGDAMKVELDKIKNKDPQVMQKIASDADQAMKENVGYSLTELGVDPMDYANWAVGQFSYSQDGAYALSDGTGSAYADAKAPDVYTFASTFSTDVTNRANAEGGKVAPDVGGQIFRDAMSKTTQPRDYYIMFTFSKQGDKWVVDQSSVDGEIDYMFGLS